jgi:sulfite exporter TauE/SafE
MDASVNSAYAQLLSVGLLWITVHCAGMCGPLILGLNLGGSSGPRARFQSSAHVVAYQAGKALAYALMGGLAGLMGHAVSRFLPVVTPWITGVLGVLLMVHAWRTAHQVTPSPLLSLGNNGKTSLLGRLAMLLDGQGVLRSVGLGVVLSIIPCGVVAWALTLAASTRHPLHGAGVMVLLAVMTTVPLVGVSLLPRLMGPRGLTLLQRWLLPLSGAWMVLVSAAALGAVPHASFGFHWSGQGYVVMLF